MEPRSARRNKEIYLDNASTSYPKPEAVYRAVDAFARNCGASPGRGGYRRALDAGDTVSRCRAAAASHLGVADPMRIAFASSSTEAINWALKGILKREDHVVVTALEHNAVLRPLRALAKEAGIRWTLVPASASGEVDPDAVAAAIRPNTRIVCAVHASNVLGNVLPIREIAKVVHERCVPLFVDGSQSAGAFPFSIEDLDVDLFAFTGHKSLLGPPGTGGLYVRPGIELRTWKEGGTGTNSESFDTPAEMPDMLEAGTPNGWGLAGLLAGMESIHHMGGVSRMHDREAQLADELAKGLRDVVGVTVYGGSATSERVGIVSMNLGTLPPGEVGRILSERYGIAVRAGLHCAPLAHEAAGSIHRGGSVRFGIGPFNTAEDIEAAVDAVKAIASSAYRRTSVRRAS